MQPHLPHDRLWGAAGGRGGMRGWPGKEIYINIFLFFPETLFTVTCTFFFVVFIVNFLQQHLSVVLVGPSSLL